MTSQWRISAIKYKICFTSEGQAIFLPKFILLFAPQKAIFPLNSLGFHSISKASFFKQLTTQTCLLICISLKLEGFIFYALLDHYN